MRSRILVLAIASAVLAPAPARALSPERFDGHLALGYGMLVGVQDAPGGSLSMGVGADYPLRDNLRLGADIGFHLLGSRTVERGSLIANLNYSVFDAALLVHWLPTRLGPVRRISAGPALVAAHVELSTAGGGAAFRDLTVDDTAPGFALDATLMPRNESAVKIGLQLSSRVGFLENDTWSLMAARLVFHY